MNRTVISVLSALILLIPSASYGYEAGESKERILLGSEMAPKDSLRQYRLKNHLIAPKGEWQCGLSVMYADFDSRNCDYMLLLQGVNANASMLRLAPEAAYTFRNNHAVGARVQYTNIIGMLDSATADLLGNFSMSLQDIDALSQSMSGCVFQRTYVGLDGQGRLGLFWDYVLGYTRTKTQVCSAGTTPSLSVRNKAYLGFCPGMVYFPMNNLSVQMCLSLAELSYVTDKAYSDGRVTGGRQAWKAQASVNALNLYFGITIHL